MAHFFKTSSACGAFFGILSAVSGFVIGAYIPISQFSDRVQTVCNIFPASHITILLRNTLLKGILKNIDTNIGGIDEGAFVRSCTLFSKPLMFLRICSASEGDFTIMQLIPVFRGFFMISLSKLY